MRIIGCDLHARQQTLAMLDTATGEVVEVTLQHEGDNVREFYSSLPGPVRVGIEATGSMQWFLNLLEGLGIECLVGHSRRFSSFHPRRQQPGNLRPRRGLPLTASCAPKRDQPRVWVDRVFSRFSNFHRLVAQDLR